MINQIKKSFTDNGSLSFKKIMTLLIFGAIIIVFAINFGLPGTIQGAGIVASVNGTVVSLAEFNTALNNQERMYQQMGFNLTPRDLEQMRGNIADNLIQQEVTFQTAEKIGVMVSAEEIRQSLFNDYPVFQTEGRFDKNLYFQLLEANRLNASDFENSLKKGKATDKLIGLFQAAGQVSVLEKKVEAQLAREKLQFSFLKMDRKDLEGKPAFLANADAVKAALSDSALLADLKKDFAAREKEFSTEAEARARHILVKTMPGDSAADAAALKKIEALKTEIAKKGFAAVAKASSEDEGSKDNGGDLGFFPKGAMVPEFEAYAFSGELKKVSEPIKSQFGYHLIEVLERKEAAQKTFDEVKTQLAREFLTKKAVNTWISDLEKLVAEKNWMELDKKLNAAQLSWKETAFVSMGEMLIPEIGSSTVSQIAFGLSEKNPRTESVIRDGESLFLVQFKARKTDEKAILPESNTLGRGNDFYQKWTEQAVKEARIEKNQAVISGAFTQ